MRNEDLPHDLRRCLHQPLWGPLECKLESVFGIAVYSSDVSEVGVAGTCEETNSRRTEGGRVMDERDEGQGTHDGGRRTKGNDGQYQTHRPYRTDRTDI